MRTIFIHIQKATAVVQILAILLPLVVANTEIVNFGLDTGADDAPVVLLPEFVSWWYGYHLLSLSMRPTDRTLVRFS